MLTSLIQEIWKLLQSTFDSVTLWVCVGACILYVVSWVVLGRIRRFRRRNTAQQESVLVHR
jgi:hypothetical protein